MSEEIGLSQGLIDVFGRRWAKGNKQIRGELKAAGLTDVEANAVISAAGLPGKALSQEAWIIAASDAYRDMHQRPDSPSAVDWNALFAALLPIIEQLMTQCTQTT